MKNFYNIADVILLILSITNILIKAGIAIYNAIKKKQVNKIPEIIDDTIDKLEEVHKDE